MVFGLSNSVTLGWASVSGNLGVSGLTVSSSTKTWTATPGKLTTTIKSTASSGCSGTTYSTTSADITIKNTSGGSGILKCNIETANASTFSPTDNPYSKLLENNATVKFSVTSASGNDSNTTMTLSNITFTPASYISVTFVPCDVDYTVDGTTVHAGGSNYTVSNKLNVDSFQVSCPSRNDYVFLGWYSSATSSFGDLASVSGNLMCQDQDIIYPRYGKTGSDYPYGVNSLTFESLDDACVYSGKSSDSNDKKIVVRKNVTFSGSCLVPYGSLLLIPFDSDNTVYKYKGTNEPATIAKSDPSCFRTLTMAANSEMTVVGEVAVPSNISKSDGRPSGAYGAIKMESGSSITLEGTASLYCYGYIWGDGSVHAKSGASVYECFQLLGWRGGNATSEMLNNSQKVFPMNQYYVQNIEACLRLDSGAIEKCITSVDVSVVGTITTMVTFIGTGGMFVLNSGYITKRYDPSRDFLEVSIYGNVTVSYVHITISALGGFVSYTMESENYCLPIMGGMTIAIKTGTLYLAYESCFFPNSELVIDYGATLSISSNASIYLYDSDDWGSYACNANSPTTATNVPYSPNPDRLTHKETKDGKEVDVVGKDLSNLADASFDLNGTLSVGKGCGLYTTQHGANVFSSEETGRINFADGPGTKTETYQANQSGNTISSYASIPITNAKLKNGSAYILGGGEEYYDTSEVPAGQDVLYNATYHKWGEDPHLPDVFDVVFRDTFTENEFTLQLTEGETMDMPPDGLAKQNGFYANCSIKMWNYAGASSNVWFEPGKKDVANVPTGDEEIVFEAFYGGFKDDVYYLFEGTALQKASLGLLQLDSKTETASIANGDLTVTAGNVCLFGSDGKIVRRNGNDTEWVFVNDATTYGGDGKVYYLNKGVVQGATGWKKYSGDYYYFKSDYTACQSQSLFINVSPLPQNVYSFDTNGKLMIPDTVDSNGKSKCGSNAVTGFGLFVAKDANNNDCFFYSLESGDVVKNKTFYVSKPNGYTLGGTAFVQGLYYFDENGCMYYGDVGPSGSFSKIIGNSTTAIIGGLFRD